MKRTVKILLGSMIILCLIIGLGRFRNPFKENIFEIPGTEKQVEINHITYNNRSFMIQRCPLDKNALINMINDYVDNNISVDIQSENIVLTLDFYTPSLRLPVYFEENKNFFKMDDYIEHYTEELIIEVVFEGSKKSGKYIFYKN